MSHTGRLDALAAGWDLVVARLGDGPWPVEVCRLDLAVLMDRATHPSNPQPLPGRRKLAQRWGVSDWTVRKLLREAVPTTATTLPTTPLPPPPQAEQTKADNEAESYHVPTTATTLPTTPLHTRKGGTPLPAPRSPLPLLSAGADVALPGPAKPSEGVSMDAVATVCAAWKRHYPGSRWNISPPKSLRVVVTKATKKHTSARIVEVIDHIHRQRWVQGRGGGKNARTLFGSMAQVQKYLDEMDDSAPPVAAAKPLNGDSSAAERAWSVLTSRDRAEVKARKLGDDRERAFAALRRTPAGSLRGLGMVSHPVELERTRSAFLASWGEG